MPSTRVDDTQTSYSPTLALLERDGELRLTLPEHATVAGASDLAPALA